jgi:GR25 family glycosyltransferase involved in LPS biosynthesis
MKTKVITLGGERWDSFKKRMEGKIEFEMFEAYTPDKIDDFVSFFEKSNVYEYSNERNPQAVIACAKSHLYIWIESFNKKETILVLEDDVAFTSLEAEDIFKKRPWESEEFDVFYLDGEKGEDFEVRDAQVFHSGCSYIITPEGSNKILTKIFESGYDTAVDWELMNSQHYGMRSLSLKSAIFEQLGTEKSNIKI